MPTPARVFRVFVSSTFNDLRVERAALHDRVFPQLRQLCAGLGADFQPIDLRWGISTEASADQRAVTMCLEEVDRCRQQTPRPRFVLLLGERYGWRPPPPVIPAAEVRRLRDHLAADDLRLVERWYVEDTNAVPAAHLLQPRRGRYEADETWAPVERRLHTVLAQAAAAAGLDPKASRRYHTSVTEQETERGIGDAPERPGAAYAFFRTTDGLPGGAAAGQYADVTAAGRDTAAGEALHRLRADVVRRLGDEYIFTYRTAWEDGERRPTLDHIDALCEDVYAALAREISAETAASSSEDALTVEDRRHESFGAGRRSHFVGRRAELDVVLGYLAGADPVPLLVSGAPGSGKTALLAEAAHRLTAGSPATTTVVRFVGATPRSAALRTLLTDLVLSLRRLRGAADPAPVGVPALAAAFREEISAAADGPGVVLVLDALDQLSGGEDLAWLPPLLPVGVRIVLSAPPGDTAARLSGHLGRAPVELGPMAAAEGDELLRRWLVETHRDLQPHQRREVRSAFTATGSPLLLRFAFEEARRWTSSTDVPPGTLPGDLTGIIAHLLDRLETDHGPRLVRGALGYLAAARFGLSESEELDLLSGNGPVLAELIERSPYSPAADGRLPPVLWARLFADLEPYLNAREADGRFLLGFYHRELTAAVSHRYLREDAARGVHDDLARYFEPQPLDLVEGDAARPNMRKLSEQAYQQTRAGRWNQLYATLTDLTFLDRKVGAAAVEEATGPDGRVVARHLGGYEVQDDLADALRAWPAEAGEARREALRDVARAVVRESHTFVAHPGLARQQLANRLQWGGPAVADLARREARQTSSPQRQPWLRLRTRFAESDALVRRLDHGSWLQTCAVTPDGTRIVSAGGDKVIRVWDATTGRPVRVLGGTPLLPISCAVTPDGRYVVATTGGGEGRIHVWAVDDGRPVAEVVGHRPSATACAVTPDGRSLMTVGTDGCLRWWTLPELRELGETVEATEPLTFGVLSPDGTTIAFGGRNGRVAVRTVPGHDVVADLVHSPDGGSLSCAFGADPRTLVTAGEDGRVLLWQPPYAEGVLLAGPGTALDDCALSPDGAVLAVGDDDGRVGLWRSGERTRIARLSAHTMAVVRCSFNADATLLATAGGDGTVCVWDVAAAAGSRGGGHTQLVTHCAFVADGATLITASTDGTVRRWATDTGAERGPATQVPAGTACMAVAGEVAVVAAGDDGSVHVVPCGTARAPTVLGEHGAPVWAIAVAADASYAVTAGTDGACAVWDLDRHAERLRLPGGGPAMRACAVAASGALVVCGDDGGTVQLWNPATGERAAVWRSGTGGVWTMNAAAPDRILVGGQDGTVRWYPTEGDGEGEVLGRHDKAAVEALSWLGDDRVASAAADGTIAVWHVDGTSPLSWSAHDGAVLALAVIGGGELLLSGGADGVLAVWEARTGRRVAALPLGARIHTVAVHPRAPVFGCGGDGGLAHIAEAVGPGTFGEAATASGRVGGPP